jgi:hypothetical protein
MPASNLYGSKSNYKIAQGHDVLTSSLQLFTPQPRSAGLKYTRVTYLGGGTSYAEGAYVELQWSALDDVNAYIGILTKVGVYNAHSQSVTIWARDENWEYARFNGLALKPLLGADASWEYFPRDVTMLIKNLDRLV